MVLRPFCVDPKTSFFGLKTSYFVISVPVPSQIFRPSASKEKRDRASFFCRPKHFFRPIFPSPKNFFVPKIFGAGGNCPVPFGAGGKLSRPFWSGGKLNCPVPFGAGGNCPVPFGVGGNCPVPFGRGEKLSRPCFRNIFASYLI